MSLMGLADRAARKRTPGRDGGPQMADDAGDPPPKMPASAVKALDKLVEFIPVETITLFWLAVSAAKALAEQRVGPDKVPCHPTPEDWVVFWVALALTPVLFLLAYLSKLAPKEWPPPPWKKWPWWKAGASTAAFAAWAFAAPGNPYFQDTASVLFAWVVAAAVSTLLTLLDPIMTRWLGQP